MFLTAVLTPAGRKTQHLSCFPPSNTHRTTDVYMVVTTQLNVNKLATTLLLLLCVWGADSTDHFIHKRLYKNNRKFYFTGSV